MIGADHERRQAAFREFAEQEIAPNAATFDRTGAVHPDVVSSLAKQGWLGGAISSEYGGQGWDNLTYGLLCAELGRACSSTRSLLTVHSMVAHTIERWGTADQKARWLPSLATGEAIAAFCLTEPETGSDAKSVKAAIDVHGDVCRVTAAKRWTTFGLLADVVLVIGRAGDAPAAILVETDTPGVTRRPVEGLLGLRAAMVGDIDMQACEVPAANLVGKPGFGFSHVASTTLDHGRFSVAWGCVGAAEGCLDASLDHAATRHQFGAPLASHQLVRRLLSDMLTGVRSARLLSQSAADMRDRKAVGALAETMMAKYHASQVFARTASDAVQIHGAVGCTPDHPVERHYRDAKIMQIIEGSDEMQQLTICEFGLKDRRAQRGRP